MSTDSGAADAARAALPVLTLRLVRSHGDAAAGTLSVPAGGMGLAEALALDGRAPDESQRREADLCRMGLREGRWRLSNQSHVLACTLNGERVPPGASIPIGHGDLLEIALLRWIVELDPADSGTMDLDARDPGQSAPPGKEQPDDGWRNAQPLDDLFGVLDIDGARPRPQADPLAELLGEAPGAHRLPAKSATKETLQKPESRRGRPQLDAAEALLDDLHQQFVRAVRDPARLAQGAMWEGSPAPVGERTSTTLETLSREAVAAYPMVRDMLQARETIDQVLGGFDHGGATPLLDVDAPEEVLRLFAPDLAQSVRIPSLTRREHHALSPDSPMPIERLPPASDASP
jgi:hypothetical protein